MKKEDFYQAATYTANLGLELRKDTISTEKVRDFVKKCPDIVRVLLEYLKEIDSLEIKPGDAVVCADKKRRLVVDINWDEVEGQMKLASANLIDVDGYKISAKIETLKKLK